MLNRRGQANVLAIIAVVCAVVTTALVVRREFTKAPPSPFSEQATPLVQAADRRSLESTGHRIGPASAELTVVEFADLECPACAQFANTTYPKLKARYGDRIALVYRHWPLEMHKFSYAAAHASECAAAQGQFERFHKAVFSQQKLLGVKPFSQFAAEAGVPNIKRFEACLADSTTTGAIEADIRAVRALDGRGTPVIVVNGWVFRSGASPNALDSITAALTARKSH